MTKNDVYGLVQEGLAGLDEKALQQVLQHLDGIVFGIDKTNEKLDTLDTSLDFIAAALTGEDPVAIATAQGLGRVRPSAPVQTQQPQQTNEEQTPTMKLNYEKLARLVKEELEVILTDEEASEMFGLNNMVQEAPQAREVEPLQEDGHIFAPNHYCVHHGAVQNEGAYVAAKAVKHNFNEELGRVTHYDMQLADGTVLENIAAEDILVTEASLAEGHNHPVAKRDKEEEDDELSPDEGGPSGTSAKKDTRPDSELTRDVKEDQRLEEYGAGSCRGECNDSGDFHKCMEKCKERKRSEKARSDAKLDKRIGTGSWGEGKVAMSRKDLTDMIREEMARLVIIEP